MYKIQRTINKKQNYKEKISFLDNKKSNKKSENRYNLENTLKKSNNYNKINNNVISDKKKKNTKNSFNNKTINKEIISKRKNNIDIKTNDFSYINDFNTINNCIEQDLNVLNNKINKRNIEDSELFSLEDESSFEMMAMQTARNKWRNNKKENNKNNQIHDIIEIIDDMKIYKYSNEERVSNHKYIYQYYYDYYEEEDYQNANIILFIGKTGDGKTTAINAFFNIVKGIDMNSKYRYILIKESEKPKGQSESQTDGIHLYYLKDSNNNPIIIIDSQGFGDTRGKDYDELINKAFEYTFTNIIDHINIVCFVVKSSEARLDILVKYIFSSATSLFSDEICQNFFILNTHANRSTIRKGPQFINSILLEPLFKEIFEKTEKKFWYAIESISFFDNDINDRLCKYSFDQLKEFYEERVKKSKRREIYKSKEIIKERNEINDKIKNIIANYTNIISEKKRIPKIENQIDDYSKKINTIEYKINNKKYEVDCIYVPIIIPKYLN